MSRPTFLATPLLGLSIYMCLGTALAGGPDFAAVERAIHQALPATQIDAIRPAPIPGLVEITAGHNLLYADATGRWLIVGHVYDLKTAQDVTAERKAGLDQIVWKDLPLEAAVHHGSGPLKLAVFADPDCPWCRKLHEGLLHADGVEVWEIMFPVASLHPAAHDQAVHILCQKDPAAALTEVMANREMKDSTPNADCLQDATKRIDRAVAFGQAHGIEGTPTLVAPDGRVRAGYLPPDQLKAWLVGPTAGQHDHGM